MNVLYFRYTRHRPMRVRRSRPRRKSPALHPGIVSSLAPAPEEPRRILSTGKSSSHYLGNRMSQSTDPRMLVARGAQRGVPLPTTP